MSLVSIAARIIFTHLIRGRTLAGDAILNAPLDPVEQVLKDMLPVVAVYTGVIRSKPTGRDALAAGQEAMVMELVFQAYIPPANEPTGALAGLNLHKSGAAMAIDLLQRQVLAALQSQSGEWADLWAKLVAGYNEFDSKPILVEVEGGVRVPAREVSLACRVINDPAPGAPLNQFWSKLDAKLRGDPQLVAVADLIKGAAEDPSGLPTWRLVMAELGWSESATRAAGLAPVDPTESDHGVPLSDMVVDPFELTVVPEAGGLSPAPDGGGNSP